MGCSMGASEDTGCRMCVWFSTGNIPQMKS